MRPLLDTEKAKQGRTDILRVMNGKVVLVLDPDESKVVAWHAIINVLQCVWNLLIPLEIGL